MQTPLKLPLFDLGVPLVLFYVLAPFLLLLFHVALLTRLHDLRVRIASLHSKRDLRLQLPSFDYIAVSANMIDDRRERRILTTIANVTIFVLPAATFLFFERQFLPYHSVSITWWHRLLLSFDLIFTFLIQISMTTSRRTRALCLLALNSGLVAFSVFVISFPGEPQDFLWPRKRAGTDFAERVWLSRSLSLANRHLAARPPPPEILAAFEAKRQAINTDEGEAALNAQDARSIAERLYGEPIDLSHRNLSYADMSGSSLIAANLADTNLVGADFSKSQLTDSVIEDADLSSANFSHANLRSSTLVNVTANLAEFVSSDLQAADIARSSFVGADLAGANLTIAYISNSNLDAASFHEAKLNGVRASDVGAIGADFSEAQISSARIEISDFRAADFSSATLHGAGLIADDIAFADFKRLNAFFPSEPDDEQLKSKIPGDQSDDSTLKEIQQASDRDAYLRAIGRAHTDEDFPTRSKYDDHDELLPCCMKQVFAPVDFIRAEPVDLPYLIFRYDPHGSHINNPKYTTYSARFLANQVCNGSAKPEVLFEGFKVRYPASKRDDRAFLKGLVNNVIFHIESNGGDMMDDRRADIARALVATPCSSYQLEKDTIKRIQGRLSLYEASQRRLARELAKQGSTVSGFGK